MAGSRALVNNFKIVKVDGGSDVYLQANVEITNTNPDGSQTIVTGNVYTPFVSAANPTLLKAEISAQVIEKAASAGIIVVANDIVMLDIVKG